jgi:hypothetical protein
MTTVQHMRGCLSLVVSTTLQLRPMSSIPVFSWIPMYKTIGMMQPYPHWASVTPKTARRAPMPAPTSPSKAKSTTTARVSSRLGVWQTHLPVRIPQTAVVVSWQRGTQRLLSLGPSVGA